VRREVWARDDGKCTWPLDSGGICGSTLRLEIDHVVPRGRGGPSTVDNSRLACKFHNQLAARQVSGDEWMDRFTVSDAGKVPVAGEAAI
jgi:5-methylcytosine-specific restriction endonuclease McrA